jgi:hypothetical protein
MVDAAESMDERVSCTGFFVRSRATITQTLQRLVDDAEAIGQKLKSDPPPSRESVDEEEPIALLPEHTD